MCGMAAAAPALSSCGFLNGSSNAEASRAEQGSITVGTMPIVGAAPLSRAVSEGYFARSGLDVRTSKIRSGAVAVPSLVNGDMHVTFGNYVSFIAAKAQGIDVSIIAEGSRAAEGNFAVAVLPDSSFREPSDLRGTTIGVNARNNIATLTTSSVLLSHGITPEDVNYVEIGFPEMALALERGQVDAAFLPEPFLTDAKVSLGVQTLLDPCSGATEGLPIDGYAVMSEFARTNPNTVRSFQQGLLPAQRDCQDRTLLQPQLVTSAKVSNDIAALVSQSVYPTSLNTVGLQRVADLMVQFGVLRQPVDVASMVITT